MLLAFDLPGKLNNGLIMTNVTSVHLINLSNAIVFPKAQGYSLAAFVEDEPGLVVSHLTI